MDEQTKMEKNNATRYMPMQKRKECQPPIAERVVFCVIGFVIKFFKGLPNNRY
jgi:hypothetical protein